MHMDVQHDPLWPKVKHLFTGVGLIWLLPLTMSYVPFRNNLLIPKGSKTHMSERCGVMITNRCVDIYHNCENCEIPICGRCLKLIDHRTMNPEGRHICPNCFENIWGDE